MLVKIFAALSAVFTALNIILVDRSVSLICMLGIILIRFVAYFIALALTYAFAAYVVTELTTKLDEPQEKPSKFWQWNFREMANFLCWALRMKVEVSGMEKLPKNERYLMVSNHRAFFDPIAKASAFGKEVKENYIYISKPSNFKLPLGGKVMHKCGCMGINRENNREALVTIKRASDRITNDEASIVIYPEGTRSHEQALLPFHAGSFKIAQRAGAPVVVVATMGTEEVAHNFPLKRTKVKIDILDVIDAEYVKSHSTRETAEIAQNIIQARIDLEYNKENCNTNA